MFLNSYLAGSSTLCLNWIEGFSKLICCPDTFSYSFRILRIVYHSSFCALQKKRLSTAKSKWDIAGHALATLIPVNYFSRSAFLIFATNASVHIMNKNKEIMDPLGEGLCEGLFVPLDIHSIKFYIVPMKYIPS